MRKLYAALAAVGILLMSGCGPKLTEEEKTAPPPAGPESYQAPPEGASGSKPPAGPQGEQPAETPSEG